MNDLAEFFDEHPHESGGSVTPEQVAMIQRQHRDASEALTPTVLIHDHFDGGPDPCPGFEPAEGGAHKWCERCGWQAHYHQPT